MRHVAICYATHLGATSVTMTFERTTAYAGELNVSDARSEYRSTLPLGGLVHTWRLKSPVPLTKAQRGKVRQFVTTTIRLEMGP